MAPIRKNGGAEMIIEFIVIPGLVFLAVTLTAKFFEMRNDVLYGPYIAGRQSPFAVFCNELGNIVAGFRIDRSVGRLSLRFATANRLASAIIG